MRKYLMTLAAFLCCAMVSVVFTSCSKDDDNSDSDLYSYIRATEIHLKEVRHVVS